MRYFIAFSIALSACATAPDRPEPLEMNKCVIAQSPEGPVLMCYAVEVCSERD